MRIKICLLLLVVALLMTGCAITKEISRETELVDAVVVSVNYDPPWNQPVMMGKVMTLIHHPADYEVTINYNGTIVTLNNEELYNYYEDHIGETIQMEYITITYENGEVRHKLERSG